MKINNFFATALFSVILFTGCDRSPSQPSGDMILDNLEYVQEFPLSLRLQNETEPDLSTIGVSNFAIYDSLMILSTANTDGLWSFISLPDYRNLGKFLNRGNGPFEFIEPPSVANRIKLDTENGEMKAYIYDFQKGKLLKMDVGESIRTNKLHISNLTDSLPSFLFNFVLIDSLTFFSKEVNDERTQQTRYLVKDNEKTIPAIMEKLNIASIKKDEDINILSTMTKISPNGNLLVEMPIGLNYINLYSPDGSFGKTICVGKEIYGIDKVQLENKGDRIYTFADLRTFNDFFGVVHINEDEKTYQTDREKLPSILFFNWNGKPLAELKLNTFITSFDIDFINGKLYTFDVHYEEFYEYDINDILMKINQST